MQSHLLPDVAAHDLRTCVHCGFCLPSCPTYQLYGVEMDSPRGRIMQIEAAKRGAVPLTDRSLREHLSLCLACRACETACPSGVPYGRIIEGARAGLPAGPLATVVRTVVLRGVFMHPLLMDAAGAGLRAYSRLGLRGLPARLHLPAALSEMERLLPRPQGGVLQGRRQEIYVPPARPRLRVGLIRGCAMQQLFAVTNEATAEVLVTNGCAVLAPASQRCCGALHVHAGDRQAARQLARQNIDAFMPLELDRIVINAAGCGSTLKEYGDLLADDPRYADKARRFSALVRDINELLVELEFRRPRRGLRRRVTYQDACHLAHAQRIREQPRAILRSIPGLELVEMPASDTCCGSAGIYNVTQPASASMLLERKMQSIMATGADLVAVSNPGCAIQIAAGIRRQGASVRVVHPVDLLHGAYRAERHGAS